LTRNLGKALVFATTTALVASCAGTAAHALSYRDILGNWCSATARLEFSRQAMGVFKFADKSRSSSKVQRYEFVGTRVIVHWFNDQELTSSDFGEFSTDNRKMFLQPSGDVPRREYHRC
jgi:hypothetical protein